MSSTGCRFLARTVGLEKSILWLKLAYGEYIYEMSIYMLIDHGILGIFLENWL